MTRGPGTYSLENPGSDPLLAITYPRRYPDPKIRLFFHNDSNLMKTCTSRILLRLTFLGGAFFFKSEI